jgi:hypothetical protein
MGIVEVCFELIVLPVAFEMSLAHCSRGGQSRIAAIVMLGLPRCQARWLP